MAKKSSGLLNQNIEEPIVELTPQVYDNNENEIVEVVPEEILESQVYEEKEEIVEVWKNSGILDKLENNLDENIAKQFESKNIFTVNEPIGKKSVSQLSRSEFRTYQRTGILPSF
jgi:murein L,D-transpeptidase YafK